MNIIYMLGDRTWGAPSQYMLDLAEAMMQRFHNVTVAVTSDRRTIRRFDEKGIRTAPVLGGIQLISMFKMSAMLKKSGPTVIHVGNKRDASTAMRAIEMSGNKDAHLIFTVHEPDDVRSQLAEAILAYSDALIIPHEADSAMPAAVDRKKIHLIPYGVPPMQSPRPTTSGSGEKVIMFHGRITPDKNLDTLFEAAAKITDLDFTIKIYGEGSASHVMPLKQTTRRLGIESRVSWEGYIPDVKRRLNEAVVGVYINDTASALAIKESLDSGVTVITGQMLDRLATADRVDTLADSLRAVITGGKEADTIKSLNAPYSPLPYPELIQKISSIYSGLL